jgi:hypothetical protein
MMNKRVLRGSILIIAILVPHIILGVYAVYDGGIFIFGAFSPERFLLHILTGDESHITVSGAMKYLAKDLCFQRCVGCVLHCYQPENLVVECDRGCVLKTVGGTPIAVEKQKFSMFLRGGITYENSTVECYESVCGFDIPIDENQTYSALLPDEVRT